MSATSNSTALSEELGRLKECPICTSPLDCPIFQCHNGHILCESCETKLESCPVCRAHLSKTVKIRSRALEALIMCLEDECENSRFGCPLRLNARRMKDHALECPYRPLSICRSAGLNCSKTCNLITCLEHMKGTHGIKGIDLMGLPWLSIRQQTGRVEFALRMCAWKPIYFKLHEELFLLSTKIMGSLMTWTVLIVGSPKTAEKFRVKVEVVGDDHSWSSTGDAIPVCANLRTDHTTLAIPSSSLREHGIYVEKNINFIQWTVRVTVNKKRDSEIRCSRTNNEPHYDLDCPAERTILSTTSPNGPTGSNSFAHSRIPSTFYPTPNLSSLRL